MEDGVWQSFSARLFQDENEVESLAAGLRSKVTTAGGVRNKVGCLCLCFVSLLTGFFQRKNKSPPEGCKTKRVYRGGSDEDPDQGASGVTLRPNPRRRPV